MKSTGIFSKLRLLNGTLQLESSVTTTPSLTARPCLKLKLVSLMRRLLIELEISMSTLELRLVTPITPDGKCLTRLFTIEMLSVLFKPLEDLSWLRLCTLLNVF
jgi:hypothetical protein